jgi:hypothetical protein
MAPLARFGESLSTAMNLARREGHDFLSLGLDEPDLGAAIMRLIEVHHMLVPPRPDADKLPMQWRVTLPGPEEPASPTDAGGRGPRPSRDIGGDDPGGDQATVNIPCPHCKRLIQARLLKAPGSE